LKAEQLYRILFFAVVFFVGLKMGTSYEASMTDTCFLNTSLLKPKFEEYHNGYMDNTRDGNNQRGIWSSKHYLIAANVNILQNVMFIFRMVHIKTVKNPILVHWIITRRNESDNYCSASPWESTKGTIRTFAKSFFAYDWSMVLRDSPPAGKITLYFSIPVQMSVLR